MIMSTPPENQGQIVVVSYGWQDGVFYRRVYDRPDRAEAWYYAADEDEVNEYIESGSEPWNAEPSISSWIGCGQPQENEDQ